MFSKIAFEVSCSPPSCKGTSYMYSSTCRLSNPLEKVCSVYMDMYGIGARGMRTVACFFPRI